MDLRLAIRSDEDAIGALMKASIRDIFPAFYDERQTASSLVHIGLVDWMLIDDGTYFVIAEAGALVACGGWSRRDKLFSGSADQEGLARLLDPTTEAARVRAMSSRANCRRSPACRQVLEALACLLGDGALEDAVNALSSIAHGGTLLLLKLQDAGMESCTGGFSCHHRNVA